ncbi:hypothetical protein Asp14428_59540 [Actinoplanes sp. NBRC 14428]|nr:hypothetical protein Asp14428_59540 [Actinoplanes sp. NBRC 14428]
MTVIELGLVTDGGDPPAGPARRPLRRDDVRRILAAVVVALCALTLTSSGLPESHAPRQLWTVPFQQDGDAFTVTGDAVYLLHKSGSTSLTAYGLGDGKPMWSLPDVGDASSFGSVESGVMLLPAADAVVQIPNDEGHQLYRAFTRETVAVDAVTGRQLWRRPGEFAGTSDGRVLLIEWQADGNAVRTLTVLGLRDGAPIWSRSAGGVETWVARGILEAGADRLLTVTPQGRVTVYDVADGRKVATGKMPWHDGAGDDGSYTNTVVDRHMFVVENVREGDGTITAYDTETLRRKWQITDRSYGVSVPCGQVFCVTGRTGISGYDRESGALRWQAGDVTSVLSLGPDRLLATDERAAAQHSLIDSATGRRIADLGNTSLVWDRSAPTAGNVYVLKRTEQPTGVMSVGLLDLRDGEIQVRGTIEPVADYGCLASGHLLACVTRDGLTVTDVG